MGEHADHEWDGETYDPSDWDDAPEPQYQIGDLVSEDTQDDVIWEVVGIEEYAGKDRDDQPFFRRYYYCRFRWTDDWEYLPKILEDAELEFEVHLDVDAREAHKDGVHACFAESTLTTPSHVAALALCADEDPNRYAAQVEEALRVLYAKRPASYEAGDLVCLDGAGSDMVVWRVKAPYVEEFGYPVEVYGYSPDLTNQQIETFTSLFGASVGQRYGVNCSMTPAPHDLVERIDGARSGRMSLVRAPGF